MSANYPESLSDKEIKQKVENITKNLFENFLFNIFEFVKH